MAQSIRDQDKQFRNSLEKVAINDVLPLEAARRKVISNWQFLGLGTPTT